MNLLNILLQAPAGNSGPLGGSGFFIMMIALCVIFYFFMMRPQQKKQKEIQKAREQLKAGDRIVTAGGIYGKIKDVDDTTMLVEVADGVRIRIDKASVFASSTDAQQK
ncbi:MAG: preprotein translocase subunit YajC [Tannerella sp.]|jgi:preprotein translocase subunit YajC|nr:preprotein translocase subunit YajC [Tannerella sp.]